MYNIRSRFAELIVHLKNKASIMGVAPENFQAETAQIVLASGGHNETPEGWHLTNLQYRGILLIERLQQSDALRLMLHTRAWLDDHDDVRSRYRLPNPEAAIIPPASGDLINLRLLIDFVDPVYIAEAENGEIDWNGRKFEAIPYDLWIAERGTVNQAPTEID